METGTDIKVRNQTAIQAWNMSGAGSHGDKKKEKNKKKCRKKIKDYSGDSE